MRIAISMSSVLRSGSLISATRRNCSRLSVPTSSISGFAAPFSMPSACATSTPAGGVLSSKVNERSPKTVTLAGTMVPGSYCFADSSLYCLMNIGRLMP